MGTYDPATFPNCEKPLANARATARLAGGRGMIVDTQESSTAYPAGETAIINLKHEMPVSVRFAMKTQCTWHRRGGKDLH